MTGGAAAKARTVSYDLTIPRASATTEKSSPAQLVVPDPTALAALDNERVQSVAANGAYASLADAQWSDALPKLLQVKILRSLEDAGRFAGVSRPLEGVTSDFQLMLDIRKFQLSSNLTAEVELGCKILGANGRVVATRIFRASVAAEAPGAPAAVAALDKAFGQVGTDIVFWTARAANEPPPPRTVMPKRTSGG
jgi:ABC-type uncharacterized transport system auxiliary subunit